MIKGLSGRWRRDRDRRRQRTKRRRGCNPGVGFSAFDPGPLRGCAPLRARRGEHHCWRADARSQPARGRWRHGGHPERCGLDHRREAGGAGGTAETADVTGCTGDGSTTLIFSFSRGAARAGRGSAGMLAVSAGASAGFASAFMSAFTSALASTFSTTVGRSAAVFSKMPFSEIPLALTPAAGRLPGAWFSGLGGSFGVGSRHGGGDGRVRGRLGHDVMVDDVGPDDGRCHRRQDVDREFRKILLQHAGHSPRRFDAGTSGHIKGSTATDRWQLCRS